MSDWSSDVCSSDLIGKHGEYGGDGLIARESHHRELPVIGHFRWCDVGRASEDVIEIARPLRRRRIEGEAHAARLNHERLRLKLADLRGLRRGGLICRIAEPHHELRVRAIPDPARSGREREYIAARYAAAFQSGRAHV